MHRQTASIVIERLLDGKMRVASKGWDQEGVLSGEQVLEIRSVSGRLHVALEGAPAGRVGLPIEPYDPYGPGKGYNVITGEGDASPVDA